MSPLAGQAGHTRTLSACTNGCESRKPSTSAAWVTPGRSPYQHGAGQAGLVSTLDGTALSRLPSMSSSPMTAITSSSPALTITMRGIFWPMAARRASRMGSAFPDLISPSRFSSGRQVPGSALIEFSPNRRGQERSNVSRGANESRVWAYGPRGSPGRETHNCTVSGCRVSCTTRTSSSLRRSRSTSSRAAWAKAASAMAAFTLRR